MKNILIMSILAFAMFGCASTQTKSDTSASGTVNKTMNIENTFGKEYTLTNMYTKDKVTIGFEKDKFFGKGPINRYFGSYKIKGSMITISENMGSTMMAGPQKSMDNESAYFKMLASAETISITEGKIIITTKDKKELIYANPMPVNTKK